MKKKVDISAYDINKINDIFNQQGWPIDGSNKKSLYNRFIRTYSQLDTTERDLFIKLSFMHRWVFLSEYQKLIVSLMEQTVQIHYRRRLQDVWIYPIKKTGDKGIIKSSDLVAYLCRAIQLQYSDILCEKNFHILGSFDKVCEKREKFLDRPLLIIDDFIGSGKYVSDVIDELVQNGIEESNIVVCSLFISENGLEQVSSKKCCIEYIEKTKDITKELSSKEKKMLMQIEKTIGVEDNFKFGYGHSGNLITLIRTPNNSLPLFWLDKRRSHSAPFPR